VPAPPPTHQVPLHEGGTEARRARCH